MSDQRLPVDPITRPICNCNADVCKELCPDKPCVEKRGPMLACDICDCTGPTCITACEEKKLGLAPETTIASAPTPTPSPVIGKPNDDQNEEVGICTCSKPCPKTCKNIKLCELYECPGGFVRPPVTPKSTLLLPEPPISQPASNNLEDACENCICNVSGGCTEACLAKMKTIEETPCDPCDCDGPCKKACEIKKNLNQGGKPCVNCKCTDPYCVPGCEKEPPVSVKDTTITDTQKEDTGTAVTISTREPQATDAVPVQKEPVSLDDYNKPCNPCNCYDSECRPGCDNLTRASVTSPGKEVVKKPCDPCYCTSLGCLSVCELKMKADLAETPTVDTNIINDKPVADNNDTNEDEFSKGVACEKCLCTEPDCLSICLEKMKNESISKNEETPKPNASEFEMDVPCDPCYCTVEKCNLVCEENKNKNPYPSTEPEKVCNPCDRTHKECHPTCEMVKENSETGPTSAAKPEDDIVCNPCECTGPECNHTCEKTKINAGLMPIAKSEDDQVCNPCDCAANNCNPTCEKAQENLEKGPTSTTYTGEDIVCNPCDCAANKCNPTCEKAQINSEKGPTSTTKIEEELVCNPCNCAANECNPTCEMAQKKLEKEPTSTTNTGDDVVCNPCDCAANKCNPTCEKSKENLEKGSTSTTKTGEDIICNPCDCAANKCNPSCEKAQTNLEKGPTSTTKMEEELVCNPCNCAANECNPTCEKAQENLEKGPTSTTNTGEDVVCNPCDCAADKCNPTCEKAQENLEKGPTSTTNTGEDAVCNPCDCAANECNPTCEKSKENLEKGSTSTTKAGEDLVCNPCICSANECNPTCESIKTKSKLAVSITIQESKSDFVCNLCDCSSTCNPTCEDAKAKSVLTSGNEEMGKICEVCMCKGRCKPECEEQKLAMKVLKPCKDCKCKGNRCNPACDKLRGLKGGNPLTGNISPRNSYFEKIRQQQLNKKEKAINKCEAIPSQSKHLLKMVNTDEERFSQETELDDSLPNLDPEIAKLKQDFFFNRKELLMKLREVGKSRQTSSADFKETVQIKKKKGRELMDGIKINFDVNDREEFAVKKYNKPKLVADSKIKKEKRSNFEEDSQTSLQKTNSTKLLKNSALKQRKLNFVDDDDFLFSNRFVLTKSKCLPKEKHFETKTSTTRSIEMTTDYNNLLKKFTPRSPSPVISLKASRENNQKNSKTKKTYGKLKSAQINFKLTSVISGKSKDTILGHNNQAKCGLLPTKKSQMSMECFQHVSDAMKPSFTNDIISEELCKTSIFLKEDEKGTSSNKILPLERILKPKFTNNDQKQNPEFIVGQTLGKFLRQTASNANEVTIKENQVKKRRYLRIGNQQWPIGPIQNKTVEADYSENLKSFHSQQQPKMVSNAVRITTPEKVSVNKLVSVKTVLRNKRTNEEHIFVKKPNEATTSQNKGEDIFNVPKRSQLKQLREKNSPNDFMKLKSTGIEIFKNLDKSQSSIGTEDTLSFGSETGNDIEFPFPNMKKHVLSGPYVAINTFNDIDDNNFNDSRNSKESD